LIYCTKFLIFLIFFGKAPYMNRRALIILGMVDACKFNLIQFWVIIKLVSIYFNMIVSIIRSSLSPRDKRTCNSVHCQCKWQNSSMTDHNINSMFLIRTNFFKTSQFLSSFYIKINNNNGWQPELGRKLKWKMWARTDSYKDV